MQGLLQGPDERSLWDTSCPLVFLIVSQDVAGRIVVSVEFSSTMGARVPAHREVFGHHPATSTAFLTGVLWGNAHDLAASLFRFATTERHELAPPGIQNAFVQPPLGSGSIGQIRPHCLVLLGSWCPCHIDDVKIFEHQHPIALDQLARLLMEKIAATMVHLAIQTRQLPFGALASMTVPLSPGDLLMRRLDLLFAGAIAAGVLNCGSIGEDGKGCDAQVKADGLFAGMKGRRRVEDVLAGKDGKPLLSFSLHRAGFDGTDHLSMQFDFNLSNFGEMQPVPDDLIATLGISEAVVSLCIFEARVARSLAIAHTAKERLHGFIEALEYVLLDLGIDVLVFLTHLLDGR